MITLPWHELVSWCIALVSATLFFVERRKNDNTKYYMVLQGILRACNQRAGFIAHTRGRSQESGRDVPCEEFDFVLNSEYANYLQLQEHIMGSMKSLQPDKDMPFDGSVTSRRGTGMLLDVSCCLSMNCQRPRVERSGAKAAILPGA